VPKKLRLPIGRACLRGRRLFVPVAGDISLMPGTGSDRPYRRVDIDVETGQVKGLF
jgi:formate--tetrahydrofolate ligase